MILSPLATVDPLSGSLVFVIVGSFTTITGVLAVLVCSRSFCLFLSIVTSLPLSGSVYVAVPSEVTVFKYPLSSLAGVPSFTVALNVTVLVSPFSSLILASLASTNVK